MSETHHGEHDDHESHGGNGKYLVVFVILCILTGASFFTYSDYWPFKETPAVGWAFMMAVSCTKALLVILFFMHLLWEANWKYVLTIPAAFMSLFLMLMLVPDVGMRMNHATRERLLHSATSPGEAKHDEAKHDEAKHTDEQHMEKGRKEGRVEDHHPSEEPAAGH